MADLQRGASILRHGTRSDVMQRIYTVEQLQHHFFIPAVEEEIFYKAIMPAELVDHQIYRFPENQGRRSRKPV